MAEDNALWTWKNQKYYHDKIIDEIKENAQASYDDTEVRELINENKEDITEIQNTLMGVEELLSQI